jgi:hypothetical protein
MMVQSGNLRKEAGQQTEVVGEENPVCVCSNRPEVRLQILTAQSSPPEPPRLLLTSIPLSFSPDTSTADQLYVCK